MRGLILYIYSDHWFEVYNLMKRKDDMKKIKSKAQDSELRTTGSGQMKGMASSMLSILLTIVLLYVAVYSLDITVDNRITITRKTEFQQDMYAMSNALEAAKLYAETALKYSTYQAFYDYGIEDKTDASSIDVRALQDKIKANLNRYTSSPYTFLSRNYEVSPPFYESVSVDVDYPSISIKAVPASTFSITRANPAEKIKLEKDGRIETPFNYQLLGKIDEIKPSKLREKTGSFMEKNWKKEAVKTIEGCENRESQIKDIDVFNVAHGTSFTSFDDAGRQVASSIEADMKSMKSDSMPEITTKKSEAKIIAQCAEEAKNDCDSPTPTFSKKMTCKFIYQYDGSFLITVTDPKKEYPVAIKEGESKKVVFKPFSFSTTNSFDLIYS